MRRASPTETALPAPPPGAPALRFDGVTVHGDHDRGRPPPVLLRDVDWTVLPGEHWAVLGANGAGKTTLLDAAAGLLTPAAGTVTVLGASLDAVGLGNPRLRTGRLEGVPRVFARRLTAVDLVVLRPAGPIAVRGGAVTPEEVSRAHELLALMGCAHLADRRYAECSQGERQRILLARVLMRDPALLLLDEPTTGLDLAGREALLAALVRVATERPALASVTVTHHLEELPSSTTHALLLREGTVMAAGPVAQVLTDARVSDCFGVPVAVTGADGRWSARGALSLRSA